MSDFNSSLPVRSEADGLDARVQIKIVDKTNPGTQQATVDTDSNLHVEMHGNDPAGVDRVLRTSEIGALTGDGVYHATTNTKPGNTGLIASVRNATPDDTTQTQRLTSVTNGTKRLLDIALHDENGAVFSEANPLPVSWVDSEGTEINDYSTVADLAGAASSNHDYTTLAAFKLTQINAAASGKLKIEIQVETAAASGTFVSRFVAFNSTANPNIDIILKEPISVAVGVKVRVIRTNKDNQAQDVYSTISGHQVT